MSKKETKYQYMINNWLDYISERIWEDDCTWLVNDNSSRNNVNIIEELESNIKELKENLINNDQIAAHSLICSIGIKSFELATMSDINLNKLKLSEVK